MLINFKIFPVIQFFPSGLQPCSEDEVVTFSWTR